MFDVSKIAEEYGQQKCTSLMYLHAFIGCDSTSAFRGIGKLKPIKTLPRQEKYIPALQKIGDTWNIPDTLFDELESYTYSVYGSASKVSKVDGLRFIRINEEVCAKQNRVIPSSNVDMATLPNPTQ